MFFCGGFDQTWNSRKKGIKKQNTARRGGGCAVWCSAYTYNVKKKGKIYPKIKIFLKKSKNDVIAKMFFVRNRSNILMPCTV